MRPCISPSLRATLAIAAIAMGLPTASSTADDHWPQFRGPGASGVHAGDDFPDAWDSETNIAWQTDIPGRAWSSPVVWGDKVFVTSAIQETGELEPVKPGLYFGGNRKAPTESYRWVVYCLDLESGQVLWEQTVHRGVPQQGCHLKNSLASETQVVDAQRVYSYFGAVGLFCHDHQGKLLWSRSWGAFATRFGWGLAASPVLHKDRIYLVNDNEEASFLVALDAATGEEVWRVERDEKSNWATPFVWENELRTEIVTPGTGKVRSYGLDGKLLWEFGGMSKIAIPTPLAGHGLLYVSSGYVLDRRRPIFAVRPGASGDISLGEEETSNQFIVWCQKQAGPYNPSPILYGDNLYVLYDMGLFACYDARTGEEIYGKQRIGSARQFTCSPWAFGGKIFLQSEDGQTFVLRAGDEFEVLRVNRLDALCMATPALARDSLIVRTESKLIRITK